MPPQTATSFYKIAQNQMITFGWNLTSVIATPTSITLSAVCANGNTYAVGPDPDGKVAGTATSVVWDVYSYQQVCRAFGVVGGELTIPACRRTSIHRWRKGRARCICGTTAGRRRLRARGT
jgi:hypothetical protein